MADNIHRLTRWRGDGARRANPKEEWDDKFARDPAAGQRSDPEPKLTTRDPIEVTWFADVVPHVDTSDLVEDLLSIGGMTVIYGESGSGKTFFATDLGLHIALGWDWNGRHVEQRAVVYCAMEGMRGIQNRVAAFKQFHNLHDSVVPFGFVTIPLDFCSSDDDAWALADAIKEAAAKFDVPVGLVLMDTLSRGMAGGNENAPDDMGALVVNGDRIRSETGAALAWIHHTGKDQAKGARGHSSLRAATDTEIEISADHGAHTMRVTKQREYECTGTFTFTLQKVELGQNPRGGVVTSCVVEHGDGHAAGAAPARRRLTGHNKRALEILADLVATSGQEGHTGVPSGYSSVPEKWWRERFYERAMPGAEVEAKKKAFRRASDALIESRYAGMTAGRVWPTRIGENDMGP